MTPDFDKYLNAILSEAQHISKECEAMVIKVLSHPLVKSVFKMDGKAYDTQQRHPAIRTGERFTFYAKYPETLADPRYSMMTTHYTSTAVKPMQHWLNMLETAYAKSQEEQNPAPTIPYGQGRTAF